uniref:Uncharacterized protein n=1 Tax=Oryza glumipatula TaxID=40148 RepID=A0A0E0AJ04_9ORYZ
MAQTHVLSTAYQPLDRDIGRFARDPLLRSAFLASLPRHSLSSPNPSRLPSIRRRLRHHFLRRAPTAGAPIFVAPSSPSPSARHHSAVLAGRILSPLRSSSVSRFSGTLRDGARKSGERNVVDDERPDNDRAGDSGLSRRCQILLGFLCFVLLFTIFCLIIWGVKGVSCCSLTARDQPSSETVSSKTGDPTLGVLSDITNLSAVELRRKRARKRNPKRKSIWCYYERH